MLAAAGPGPIMLQDLDWHGPGLALALIARLAERVPELCAVKIETAPAGPKYDAVRRATAGRLHLSGGWAAMQMLDGLARGLDAFIPSGMLPLYVRIFDLWSAARRDDARALFERALPVLAFSNQHIDVSIRFWKHVRRRQGLFATERCRPPARAFDAVQREEAARLADDAIALEAEVGRRADPLTGVACAKQHSLDSPVIGGFDRPDAAIQSRRVGLTFRQSLLGICEHGP
jgi:4-hydroxy-tetrahydrodipicolinate synthase